MGARRALWLPLLRRHKDRLCGQLQLPGLDSARRTERRRDLQRTPQFRRKSGGAVSLPQQVTARLPWDLDPVMPGRDVGDARSAVQAADEGSERLERLGW